MVEGNIGLNIKNISKLKAVNLTEKFCNFNFGAQSVKGGVTGESGPGWVLQRESGQVRGGIGVMLGFRRSWNWGQVSKFGGGAGWGDSGGARSG